ncbi:MAG: hypothetical protein WC838_07760, partial [Candidatus Margulisiibacteriota bacterium]
MKKLAFGFLALVILSVATLAVPNQLTYSGRLLQNGALVNSTLTMTFKIWTDPTAGTLLWSTSNIIVPVNQGIYSVVLDQVSSNVFTGDNAYLEVIVGGETLAPRTQINSVGYALQAASVTGLSNSIPSSGNVGIGTTAPAAKLDIYSANELDGIKVRGLSGVSLETHPYNRGYPALKIISHEGSSVGKFYTRFQHRNFNTSQMVDVIGIDHAGQVGIGTTNPYAQLDLAGNNQTGNGANLYVRTLDAFA